MEEYGSEMTAHGDEYEHEHNQVDNMDIHSSRHEILDEVLGDVRYRY